jgi:hypothetical protein
MTYVGDMTYRIELTDIARAFAARHSSEKEVEELVRKEIDELLEDAFESIGDLLFHCVESGEQEYICFPVGENVIRVDTCTREEGPVLGKGPLKGQCVTIPSADSDGRGDD